MSTSQPDINMLGNYSFHEPARSINSLNDELPQSLKDELNHDLSILLANTDDFGLNSDSNMESFIDFTDATKEEIPNTYPNIDFGVTGGALASNTIQDNSFYQHTNNHISSINSIDNDVRTPSEGALIDSTLLQEIESVLNDTKPSIKSPNKVVKSHLPKRSQQLKTSHTNKQTCAINQSNGRSLSLPSSQSSASHRLFKQRAMAQTAAVLATNSMSPTKGKTYQRHESAKAAARAVGQVVPLSKSKVANSPTMKLSLNFKKAAKADVPCRPVKTTNTDSSNSKQTGTLLQPAKFSGQSHNGLNILIPNTKSKTSSISINSTITGFSNKSYSSKESSTFDAFPPTFRSTETLETFLSQDTASPQMIPFQPPRNYNSASNSRRRTSTASSESTSSLNSLSEFLNLSTPSPNSANVAHMAFSPNNNRTFSFEASPITPVSKTAAKFEMLSTKSPCKETNIDTVIQNGPKMSIWKTPKNTPKQKSTVTRHKSLDFDHMKGFGILELSVDKARLKAKPLDTTIGTNVPKPDITGRMKTNHINNTTKSQNNYTHTTPTVRKMRVHASSASSGSNMSVTSTVSTVSMHSNKDEREKSIPVSQVSSKSTIINNNQTQQQISKRKASDLPFQSLITTFNKHEPEEIKPQVYSNMHQGLVEFQVHLDNKRGNPR